MRYLVYKFSKKLYIFDLFSLTFLLVYGIIFIVNGYDCKGAVCRKAPFLFIFKSIHKISVDCIEKQCYNSNVK